MRMLTLSLSYRMLEKLSVNVNVSHNALNNASVEKMAEFGDTPATLPSLSIKPLVHRSLDHKGSHHQQLKMGCYGLVDRVRLTLHCFVDKVDQ
ncbi:hypothetical protein Nepgr_024405 [Nepenthes gracilis]|uniref:Uncharacterized protein n=1 Tax=Nepenthes gracilis TaxID=150966 RepID=A0AAD3T5X0_NEPGR|nr:hypothetical protein Nepgr_024405 [Nepenthes gracilis]